MADHFIQGSFAFTCSIAEAALIEEAWQLAADLMWDFDPAPISDELLAVFPPSLADKPLSGFTAIFDDANLPDFGADIQVENLIEDPKTCSVSIYSDTDFQPWPIAGLIQRCCQPTLAIAPIGFDWSLTCSKPRIEGFGGGWCAIFPDRIEIESTRQALSKALDAGLS